MDRLKRISLTGAIESLHLGECEQGYSGEDEANNKVEVIYMKQEYTLSDTEDSQCVNESATGDPLSEHDKGKIHIRHF